LKAARLEKTAVNDKELALVNRQTLRELAADEVFLFRLAACDDQVDRDYERFTERTLEELAKAFVGRPVLRDHKWSTETQTARVYAAEVEMREGVKQLVLRCYMPRTAQTADTITAIESGILRECSVGCAVERVLCSICGADQAATLCRHFPGQEYDGQVCHMDLDGGKDAFEVSLCAVPAQREAGVVKAKRYGGAEASEGKRPPGRAPEDMGWRAKAALALEAEKFHFMEVADDE